MHAAGPVVAIAMDHVGQRCRKHRTVDNTDADKAKKVGHHCDGPRPERDAKGLIMRRDGAIDDSLFPNPRPVPKPGAFAVLHFSG